MYKLSFFYTMKGTKFASLFQNLYLVVCGWSTKNKCTRLVVPRRWWSVKGPIIYNLEALWKESRQSNETILHSSAFRITQRPFKLESIEENEQRASSYHAYESETRLEWRFNCLRKLLTWARMIVAVWRFFSPRLNSELHLAKTIGRWRNALGV